MKKDLRLQTWQSLLKQNIPSFWAPFMVDAALNTCSGETDINIIVNSTAFLEQCAKSSKKYELFSKFNWNGENVCAGMVGNNHFFKTFLTKGSASVEFTLNKKFNEESDEECASILFEQIQKDIPNYKPGRLEESGKYTQWGFEAYLTNYSVNRTITIMKKLEFTREIVSFDEEVGEDGTMLECLEARLPEECTTAAFTPTLFDLNTLECMVEESVEAELDDEKAASLYLLHASGEFTMDEISAALNMPKTTVFVNLQKICKNVLSSVKSTVSKSMNLNDVEAREEVLGYLWGKDGERHCACPSSQSDGKLEMQDAMKDLGLID